MTELLDRAIAKARDLPDADQDEAAKMLLWAIESRGNVFEVDDETLAAIDEGVAQAKRGDLASDVEIAALWKRYGA